MSRSDTSHSRRSFLRQAASSVGLVLTAPMIASIVASCETDETTGPSGDTFTVDLGQYPELETVGSITVATVAGLNNNNPVFISRVAQDRFAVFSTICTHQGCQVDEPVGSGDNCVCPCHGAEYSPVDGTVRGQPFGGTATNLPSFSSAYNQSANLLTING